MRPQQMQEAYDAARFVYEESSKRGRPVCPHREWLFAQALHALRNGVEMVVKQPAARRFIVLVRENPGAPVDLVATLTASWQKILGLALSAEVGRGAVPRALKDQEAAFDAEADRANRAMTDGRSRLTLQERRVIELHGSLVAYVSKLRADPEAAALLAEVEKEIVE